MRAERRAVIDIGTNSVKLLVADVEEGVVLPLKEKSDQTRLGRGFYLTQHLQREAITATAATVERFAEKARQLAADQIRVIATSAVRDANNKQELIDAIRQTSGLEVEVISGEEEADLVFKGVLTNPKFHGRQLLIMDVGGGSTELVLGEGNVQEFRASFPLGTVRLLEQFPGLDTPSAEALDACREVVREFLKSQVLPLFLSRFRSPQLVGTGGSATILARLEQKLEDFDREQIESAEMTLKQVTALTELLWSLPLEKRRELTGLPPKRADVILPGAVIYEGILKHLNLPSVRISTRGLRFAALLR